MEPLILDSDCRKQRGPFTLLSTRVAYENRWMKVIEDRVLRPDGSPGLFGVIEVGGGGGVAILPIDDGNNIVLLREYLYAWNEYGLEVAGGGIDPAEAPIMAARRELQEELGLSTNVWNEVGSVRHITTISRVTAHLFIARVANFAGLHTEPDVETLVCPLSEAVSMVISGEITASTTCCIILKAARIYGV